MLRNASIATLLFLAACGGGSNDTPSRSGLPENAQVTMLSDADLDTLCNWAVAYEGGEGTTLSCGETVHGADVCTSAIRAAVHCTVTVSQYETCAAAFRADACSAPGDPGCSAVAACN